MKPPALAPAMRLIITAGILTTVSPLAGAQPAPASSHPFYAAGELGYGAVRLSSPLDSESNDTLLLAFEAGLALSPAVQAGIRLGGWTIEASDFNNFNKPPQGESLSVISATLRYHPESLPRLFLRGAFGWLAYTNQSATGFDGNGTAGSIAIGYDIPVTATVVAAPVLDFSNGSFTYDGAPLAPAGNNRYRAISLGIEFRYQRPQQP